MHAIRTDKTKVAIVVNVQP